MSKTKFLILSLLLALAFSAVAGGGAASAAPTQGAVVSLSAAKASFGASESVLVTVTVSNPTARPVKVLKWYTPAEDVEEPLFRVLLNGQPVAFVGPHYKRPAPTGNDYILLKPGASFSREVNLGAYYDLSRSGTYQISYSVSSFSLYEKEAGAAKSVDSLTSNKIELYVQGRAGSAPEGFVSPQAVSGSTSFNKCTTSQQSDLLSARSAASNYAADSLAYLNANKTGARYTTWFGVFDSNRYSTVRTNFSKISSAMDTAAVKFDCGCKKKYYAYVYPSQPYTIYLCSVFWTAPMTGTDSKAGTLIHEMSHFTVVAGTDDFVYGQAGAKNLAITDPAKAIKNADNHEYFAENTPALP